jgi:hypothetical protein
LETLVFELLFRRCLRDRCFARGHFLCARRFLGEFETDFAFFQFQVRGKRAAFFRDEFREQIGFAVVMSFGTCSFAISRGKITLPTRKVQVFSTGHGVSHA